MKQNKLIEYIEKSWSDEVKTMNDLQDHGIVSDNAVMAKDVSSEDAEKAVKFLNEYPTKSI
jgi:hypothetical protein